VAFYIRWLVPVLLVAHPGFGMAQQSPAARHRTLAGCWTMAVGPFTAVTEMHIDSGMTNVPERVRLDTLPGVGLYGEPRGSLLRAIPDERGSRYRDGFFTAVGADSSRLVWSNGFTWLTIDARVTSQTMRGVARAATDYGGEMRAQVTLSRIACP
jgi:hypothetical protein